jgi:hypothetical protein
MNFFKWTHYEERAWMKFWPGNQYHNQVGMFKRWYPIKHPCTWESIFPMLLAWQVDEIIDRFENSISNLLQSFEIHYGYLFLALKCINYIPIFFLISWILYVQLIIERNGVQQHYLREQYSSGYLQVWLLQLEIAYFSFSQLYHFVSVFVFVNFGQILNWKKSDFNLFKGCFMKKNGTKSLKNSKSPDFLK